MSGLSQEFSRIFDKRGNVVDTLNLDPYPEFCPDLYPDPGRCIIYLFSTVRVLVCVPESMMTGGTPLPWLSWSGHT